VDRRCIVVENENLISNQNPSVRRWMMTPIQQSGSFFTVCIWYGFICTNA